MKTMEMISQKELAMRMRIRKLGEDHITWVGISIIGLAEGLPSVNAAIDRLMKNAEDFGKAIQPFYGDAAADKFTILVKEHVTGANDVVLAAKAGDKVKLDAAEKSWYANADEISTFLHNLNPEYWPLDEMKAMMKAHLDFTNEEAAARLNGDWEGEVKAYDKGHDMALKWSDMIGDGFVGQFPERYKV